MPHIQTDEYTLRTYECDAQGRLHVPALMNLMQESANRNAADYGISMANLAQHGLGWMLARFRLTMYAYPRYGQAIRVITYPTFVEKYFIYRDFQVRADDDTLLAEATSTWLIFSQKKRSMVALPPFVRLVAIPEGIAPLSRLSMKPEFAAQPFTFTNEKTVEVGWFSIDTNRHVNNVAYVQWLLEALDHERVANQQLHVLDLIYRGETHLGDTLRVQTGDAVLGTLHHRLVDTAGRDVVLAQTNWR